MSMRNAREIPEIFLLGSGHEGLHCNTDVAQIRDSQKWSASYCNNEWPPVSCKGKHFPSFGGNRTWAPPPRASSTTTLRPLSGDVYLVDMLVFIRVTFQMSIWKYGVNSCGKYMSIHSRRNYPFGRDFDSRFCVDIATRMYVLTASYFMFYALFCLIFAPVALTT